MIAALILLAAAPLADDCANPMNQSAMTMCADQDFRRADAALNAQWKITLAKKRAADAAMPPMSPREQRYADALLASQRAWLAYRDAQCVVDGQEMRGGSAEPMLVAGCKAALTRERTKKLRELAQAS